jgi:hypothetical protein
MHPVVKGLVERAEAFAGAVDDSMLATEPRCGTSGLHEEKVPLGPLPPPPPPPPLNPHTQINSTELPSKEHGVYGRRQTNRMLRKISPTGRRVLC